MSKLTMNGDEELRVENANHLLEIFLAAVAGDVGLSLRPILNVRASLEETVDDAISHLFVAGYGVRREHHRIVLLNVQRVMCIGCQAVQDRHGLTLRTSGHDDDLPGRQFLDLVERDQHIGRYF